MIKLEQLRFKARTPEGYRYSLEEFAALLDVSPTTLIRIETAERQGRKHHVSHGVAYRLIDGLKSMVDDQNVSLDDLTGVQLVAPRSGRPKKVKSA